MSSKRRIRRKACVGKIRSTTAEAAREQMLATHRPGRLNVYPCRFCGGYHVGHRPRGRRIRRKT